MRHALVVSRLFPFDATRVHAVYQRLGAQVAALGNVVDRVECLFLVPPDQRRTPEELAQHERDLQSQWSPKLKLQLAPVANEATPAGNWERFGRGIFQFSGHPIARPVSNPEADAVIASAVGRGPGIILAHRLSAMCLFLGDRAPTEAPLFFDLDDIEHVAWTRRLITDPAWPTERMLLLQTPRLIAAEKQAMSRATATFVCSSTDRERLRRLDRRSRVEVIPNSVAFPAVLEEHPTEPLVLFVGSMGSRPNAQAVDYLVREVWPRVESSMPEARLAIVGGSADRTESYAAHSGTVTFAGFVGDLSPWYRRARIVCCPIFHGSGTRVKIIEAAANGKAVVSTALGAEGLEFVNERDILLRNRAADIAASCLGLLRDPQAAARLGLAARAQALSLYTREAAIRRLTDCFATALPGAGPSATA